MTRHRQDPLPPRAGSPAAAAQAGKTDKGERYEVLQAGNPQDAPPVFAEDTGARDGMMKGTAVDPVDPEVAAQAPAIKRYVVKRDAAFVSNGGRVRLPMGKVIDETNYNIKQVIAAGVPLHLVPEGEDPSEIQMQLATGELR